MKITHSVAVSVIRLLTVACLVVTPLSALAAVDMFLKLTDIDGESKDAVHRDEIDVLAWSESSTSDSTIGSIGAGGGGKVSYSAFSLTKFIDSSSPQLRLRVANGGKIDEAILTVRKAGETPLEYFIIEMKDVYVKSISASGSGGEDRLTENVTFIFTTIKWMYTPQKEDGSGGPTINAGWDLAKGTQLP